MKKAIRQESIREKILNLRGIKVMIDRDLAVLYGVSTKALNQAVKRNLKRFPADFMFKMTQKEFRELVTNCDRLSALKHSSGLPRVFTEQGVAMLSSVLNSERAVLVNIAIMRAFVKIRAIVSAHKELLNRLDKLEQKVGRHDKEIQAILNAIRQLMAPPPEKKKEPIGFRPRPR